MVLVVTVRVAVAVAEVVMDVAVEQLAGVQFVLPAAAALLR